MEQALYRKYRPANLKEMVGQDEAVSLISSQISDEKIGHAYLFSGPKGGLTYEIGAFSEFSNSTVS